MNARQQTLETLLFGNPDRIPLDPGYGRESTLKAWKTQGLPENILPNETTKYAYKQAGGTLGLPSNGERFTVNQKMIPEFEEKLIEKKSNSQIVQDWKGNICEIGLEFDVTYLKSAIDFVTRRWIKCPVENRKDWKDMMTRYDADDITRISENLLVKNDKLKNREDFISINFSGPYWQLREWCGFEGLSILFYDDPILVMDMIKFWEDFVTKIIKKILKHVTPDQIYISEDMAYKGFSMLSPKMTEEFLLPTWKRWGELIRNSDVPIYAVDSDGFIGELIPIWLEAGVNVCDPIEVAAGNDINLFRKQFGKNMAYRGGVDKREMAKGGVHIEKEIARLEPVIKDGGFIPSCDHGVPADVSWPNFVYYTKLLGEQTGWL